MNFRLAIRILFPALAVAAGIATAHAQHAPSGLRGKSVTVSWTETRLQRVGGEGEFSERSFQQNLSVYISETGRAFARRTVTSNRGKRSRSADKSSVGESDGRGQSARVSGRSIVVTNSFRSGGARMAKIDVDASFASCSATVILGRENSDAVVQGRSLINRKKLEIKSAKVSNTTCAIRAGNVFGE